jgi:2-polyprenyl-3-methyl-5-hydroxy-6-metoxy-1,4-benzoquinol methylase
MTSESALNRILQSRFQQVDRQADPSLFFSYLDRLGQLPGIEKSREAGLRFLQGIERGQIAEVGCGVGTMAARIASMMPKPIHVTGWDKSAAMIGEAKSRHCSVARLSFGMGSFDAVETSSVDALWLERVLVHTPEPEQALVRCIQGLKPNGKIVVLEPDWGTLVINGVEDQLQRKWLLDLCGFQVQGTIGRSLPVLLRRCSIRVDLLEGFVIPFASFSELNQIINIDWSLQASTSRGTTTKIETDSILAQLKSADKLGDLCGMFVLVGAFGTLDQMIA